MEEKIKEPPFELVFRYHDTITTVRLKHAPDILKLAKALSSFLTINGIEHEIIETEAEQRKVILPNPSFN